MRRRSTAKLSKQWQTQRPGSVGFCDLHEQPRAAPGSALKGWVAETRKKFHDGPSSLYEVEVNSYVLGSKSMVLGKIAS